MILHSQEDCILRNLNHTRTIHYLQLLLRKMIRYIVYIRIYLLKRKDKKYLYGLTIYHMGHGKPYHQNRNHIFYTKISIYVSKHSIMQVYLMCTI